jgi:hypothetical protein
MSVPPAEKAHHAPTFICRRSAVAITLVLLVAHAAIAAVFFLSILVHLFALTRVVLFGLADAGEALVQGFAAAK